MSQMVHQKNLRHLCQPRGCTLLVYQFSAHLWLKYILWLLAWHWTATTECDRSWKSRDVEQKTGFDDSLQSYWVFGNPCSNCFATASIVPRKGRDSQRSNDKQPDKWPAIVICPQRRLEQQRRSAASDHAETGLNFRLQAAIPTALSICWGQYDQWYGIVAFQKRSFRSYAACHAVLCQNWRLSCKSMLRCSRLSTTCCFNAFKPGLLPNYFAHNANLRPK